MPVTQTQNTQVFHASSIGRQNYVVLAPNSPAAHVGCALVFSTIEGLTQASNWTANPVLERPAALPVTPSVVVINAAGVASYLATSGIAGAAVQYTPQTLTLTEQQQARTNIGILTPQLVTQSGWVTPTSYFFRQAMDADNDTLQQLCDTVASVIESLKAANVFSELPVTVPQTIVQQFGWTTLNWQVAKILDADATPLQQLADIVATIIDNLKSANVFAP
jgi:hypothetical protein